MLVKLRSLFSAAAVALCLSLTVWGQAAAEKKPEWKDRAEYDLVQSIQTAPDAKKRLELLNQWKEKYAATDFNTLRMLLYLETYQQLNDTKNGMETAKAILAADPKEFRALNYIVYFTPLLNVSTPEALDLGEKAAKGMLEGIPATFEDSKKPANVTAEQWGTAKKQSEALAHKTLGWVAMIRKQNDQAEASLRKSLEVNPDQGDVYYWLANVVTAQRKPERQSEVLFRYARAAVYDGPGALPPAGRKEVEGYLTKAYTSFHGSTEGLEELKKLAKASIDPPAGFKVVSKAELMAADIEKQNKFLAENPELALWMNLKKELTGDAGPQYFEEKMKDAGYPKLKGKVVSHTPAVRPKEILVAIENDAIPEVTLKIAEGTMPGKADPGTPIEVEMAVPKSFTKDPFMVIMEVEPKQIKGWPAAAAAKPAGAKRPAAGRKKR